MTPIIDQIDRAGLTLSMTDNRLRIGPPEKLTPELRQRIKAHAEVLRTEALRRTYEPQILTLWAGDPIGPLACWAWFGCSNMPVDGEEIASGLHATMDLHRWVVSGINAGPSFPERDRLYTTLLALSRFVKDEPAVSKNPGRALPHQLKLLEKVCKS